MKRARPGFLALLCLAVSVLLLAPLDARELPVRSFTTADGLSDNRVHRIVLDSRGLLWVLTASGISRFDGSHFQNFDDEPLRNSASRSTRSAFTCAASTITCRSIRSRRRSPRLFRRRLV